MRVFFRPITNKCNRAFLRSYWNDATSDKGQREEQKTNKQRQSSNPHTQAYNNTTPATNQPNKTIPPNKV